MANKRFLIDYRAVVEECVEVSAPDLETAKRWVEGGFDLETACEVVRIVDFVTIDRKVTGGVESDD